jgi:hypothetical protein
MSIVLESPDRSFVIDVLWLSDEARAGSLGRYPDGSAQLQLLKDSSPGSPNHPPFPSSVVINEIMYRPVSGDERDEYVELYNPSATPVDVGGWSFTDGISFTIPAGRVILQAATL